MNIGEANATMNALRFLKGDIDHCDETTRSALARDLLWLQTRANATLGAGLRLDEVAWNEALFQITFEPGPSAVEPDPTAEFEHLERLTDAARASSSQPADDPIVCAMCKRPIDRTSVFHTCEPS